MKNCRLTILKGALVLLLSICSFISYGSSYYYAGITVEASGKGKVYVTADDEYTPKDNDYQTSATASDDTTDEGGEVTFIAYAKEDQYYQFDGWYDEEKILKSTEKVYSAKYPTASAAGENNGIAYSLVAKFSPKPYTITYDYNYDGITAPVTYDYESEITILDPVRSGYVFDYWTVSSPTKGDWIKDEKYYAGQTLTLRHENVTLQAHWRGNLTITSVGLDATDNVIYDVSSMDGESVYHLVADVNNLSSTILGIPAGDYVVTPRNDWSLKYNPVQAQKVTIESGTTPSLSFTFSKKTSPNNISETSKTF